MCDYQESVTTGQTDRQTPDKVIPMCRYASQETQKQYCIQGKFRPRYIFALFALWPEGEFKSGPIELYRKDYLRKLECGQIQDWANQS